MSKRKIFLLTGFLSLFLVGMVVMSIQAWAAQSSWPPQLGKMFPDTEFIDQEGKHLRISDFKGKVIVVEYIGMNCPACQAFSGADKPGIGPFEHNDVQHDLLTLEDALPRYSLGVSLFDDGIVFVQVLLYDMKMGATKPDDAKHWAEHFKMNEKPKKFYVVVPTEDLRGDGSYNLIPGCHLVDKNLVVRSDSAGHSPKHNLYTQLFPMVAKLLKE